MKWKATAAVALLLGLAAVLILRAGDPGAHAAKPPLRGYVVVAHLVPAPVATLPRSSEAQALAAIGKQWGSVAQAVPKSVQFGAVDPHLTSLPPSINAWVISYSVDISPPSGGGPATTIGPPNVHTMTFIVDDATNSVVESIGYFD